ncbi:MAG: tRNA-modifying protein YgfZ [Buchnera aphidicola (Periphyllus lyropictus)]|uniref:tRNA-modifying protein YgfZ n=1 Tax=Buchnera aphidicola TaxID=9 RepID=UPI001EBC8964|nr:tRNA-modifying protein YgfZ [Buchnera aphidicola]NIH16545.1 tRNA-modifying protein YgfZ [Buchnera aphidicola (Periphyllus lyropictus)]USS94438.1 tRNA-modifying protein YgfZ [Buchnera aphidicola (Periphyllus lyropictus)]
MKKFFQKKNKVLPLKSIYFSIIFLKDWKIIKVSKKDSKKYLQNQLTADMNLLNDKKYIFCGHCNDKGKVWSTLLVFKKNKSYFYILRKSVKNTQIKAIKKFSIFFQVKILEQKSFILLGVLGNYSYYYLKKFFKNLPNKKNPVMHFKNMTIIYINKLIKKYILIMSYKKALFFIKFFKNIALFNDSKQWLSIEIEEKFPIIEKKNMLNFFPQEISLHKFKKGISFNKGCYIGQEQITKIKYKKINKKSLYILFCKNVKNHFFPGDLVYVKIRNSWIKKGILLSSVIINKKKIYAQIVLNKIYKNEKLYKIKNSYFYKI